MDLRWHQKLGVKIAGICLIFFALLAFSLHWNYDNVRRQMIESNERDAQKLAHSVKASILTFVLGAPEGGALIKDLVVKLNENLKGVAVHITHSRSLDLQYGVDPLELAEHANETLSLADGNERFWEDDENWRFAMPIKSVAGCGKCHLAPDGSGQPVPDGYTLGVISFSASMKPMNIRLTQLRADLARNLGIMSVLFVFMALFMNIQVARPLRLLLAAVQSVARGNMETRVNIGQADEIGRLGDNFNTLAEQMEQSFNRLKTWNIDLAEEVERQTQSIREIRDRHKAIIDSTQRIILTTDNEMKIESVNAEFDVYAARSNMPIRSADLVGRSLFAFL
ncbi:MAG: HAMP domain-containing protein, partial [Nitrospinae bacterium]|nr:HAMP domain-containing protein [Nitrospinota bacterium]